MKAENRAKLLPLCHVKYQNGMGGIEIDGVNYGAMNGYVAFCDNRSWTMGPIEPPTLDVLGDKSADSSCCDAATIREMYLAGVRIYALNFNVWLYWKDNGVFEYDVLIRDLEKVIGYIRKYAPDSYFTIRWGLFVPAWWAERYPTEVLTYNDGTNRTYSGVHASYTSEIWREQAGEILEKSIKRIIDSELVHYFAGIQLCYGNCGEWNNFGYHERHFPDFSECTQNAFKKWGGKEIPKPEERLRDRDKTLRNLPEGKNAADFYQFWQETTVDTILYFAHIVRTVTEGRSLVGTFYGYYVGHLYHFTGPYHFQDSGHYAVGRLIESNDIDFLAGPYAYDERRVTDIPQSAYSSIQLHGKLLYSENDQRTHRSIGQEMFGKTENLMETIAITKRNFTANLTRGCTYYYFDFVRGWYREPEFYAVAKKCKKTEKFLWEAQEIEQPEVAVFFSEETVPYMGNGKNEVTVALARMMRRDLDMAGAPYSFYTMKDAGKADLSNCKLVIFLNAYYIPEDQRKMIEENVMCNGRTVVFLHSAGCVKGDSIDVKAASDWIGIHFEEKKDMVTDRVHLCSNPDSVHKISNFLNTMYVVEDADAVPLAQYTTTEYIAAAEKKKDDHRVVYWAMPTLDENEMRMLYTESGVHIYSEGELVVHAMGQFVSVYSRKSQKAQIRFKKPGRVVFDMMTGEILARDTDLLEVEFDDTPDTRMFFAGTGDDWERYMQK